MQCLVLSLSIDMAKQGVDLSTENRIKEAARKVFHAKGYAGTRTRDIAEEAGINLALLNYYFKSKEKLFEVIMFETTFHFMSQMALIFNDTESSLEQKVERMCVRYLDLLLQEPDMPLFIMSELRQNAVGFLEKLPVAILVANSVLVKQYQAAHAQGKVREANVLHFLVNLMGLVVFPFVASPMVKAIGGLHDKEFESFAKERRDMIPMWMGMMFYKV